MKGRILYIQYTNPGAYPPLERSSRILANRGWNVRFLGVGALGGADMLELPTHPLIEMRKWRYCKPGLRQKLHFASYALWALWTAVTWRPEWVYASDLMACPIALLLSLLPGVRILYHEHDSPDVPPRAAKRGAVGAPETVTGRQGSSSVFQRFLLWSRLRVAHRAALCVLPNEARIAVFRGATNTKKPVLCVWNCPAREEVRRLAQAGQGKTLRLFFHGSIVPAHSPLAVLAGMRASGARCDLTIAGYETIGHLGYRKRLSEEAERTGLGESFHDLGAISHHALLSETSKADIGLAFMPLQAADINSQAMTGASNKPFDYLACGLALLVSDLPDWRRMFVDSGYGLACNPDDPSSIAAALRWFAKHPGETRAMGERGRQRILREWNYETQFAPLLAKLEGASGPEL